MTKGLESASRKKLKLYKQKLTLGSMDLDKEKYIRHQNIYNQMKQKLMMDFYKDKCLAYQNNTKKLWQLINNTISKERDKGSIISHIMVDGIKHYTSSKITHVFGKFYSNIGKNLASNIRKGERYIQHLLNKIDSVALHGTTQIEIEQIIKQLANKTSYGHNQISNTMLKFLNNALSYPLCIIFNQSI